MPRGHGGRHGGGHGGGRHGRHHGGRHHGGRGWGGGYPYYGYPYYGYPYYDDFLYRNPDPQVIVVDKDRGQESGSGINWPTIAISMMLSAFMLMRR